MASMAGKFEPKVPVSLAPPKTDPISQEHLAKCNGQQPRTSYRRYIASK